MTPRRRNPAASRISRDRPEGGRLTQSGEATLHPQDRPAILTEVAQFFAARFPQREEAAFLVGGFLRDCLRSGAVPEGDELPPDLDIAVPRLGMELMGLGRELADRLDGAYVSLSPTRNVCRIVAETSRETDGPGTERRQQHIIDLAGFFASDPIEDDLARRDFTINALALPLSRWRPGPASEWADSVIDPFGGRADLAQQRLRALSPDVFRSDPGRLLRAVRLAGQLRLRLEPETARLIRQNAPLLERVSPERVRDQFLLILAGDGARGQLEVLDRLDLLCRVIPELAATKGVDQTRAHYWDVWNHLLHTVEFVELVTRGHQHSAIYSLAPWTEESAGYFAQEVSDGHSRRTLLKLAALLHDIAKPQTKKPDATGRIRFLGHSELGADMARTRLQQLRLSSRGTELVAQMVRHHLRPAQLRNQGQTPSLRAIHRYYREVKDAAVDTVYLALADYLAAKGPEIAAEQWAEHARMLTYVLQVGPWQAPARGPARLVTGHDLMEGLGLPPGPRLGRLLEQIDEAQAAGEVSTREEALALAKSLVTE